MSNPLNWARCTHSAGRSRLAVRTIYKDWAKKMQIYPDAVWYNSRIDQVVLRQFTLNHRIIIGSPAEPDSAASRKSIKSSRSCAEPKGRAEGGTHAGQKFTENRETPVFTRPAGVIQFMPPPPSTQSPQIAGFFCAFRQSAPVTRKNPFAS